MLASFAATTGNQRISMWSAKHDIVRDVVVSDFTNDHIKQRHGCSSYAFHPAVSDDGCRMLASFAATAGLYRIKRFPGP